MITLNSESIGMKNVKFSRLFNSEMSSRPNSTILSANVPIEKFPNLKHEFNTIF